MAAELAAGRTGLADAIGLYHMLLEGVVFEAGQHALLDDLDDGALPGVRDGVERVERDERWHIGFGLRCLIETRPSPDLFDDLMAQAEDAAEAWGDAVPSAHPGSARRACAPGGWHVAAHEAERQVAVARHWPAWRVDRVPGPT